MAAFHAAQATIFERTGRVVKTHKGVHSTFAQIVKDDPLLGAELGRFLMNAYTYKDAADYRPRDTTTPAKAEEAIAGARHLVERVKAALGSGGEAEV